jgi:hypothetical protein
VQALPRIRVFVEARAVEVAQPVRVVREMPRDPVDQNSQASPMAAIDEDLEVLGTAETAGRREQPGGLVTPGRVEGVLGDGKQFDVGEAHVRHVGDEFVGQLSIREKAVALLGLAPPGTQVNLVDGDRRVRVVGSHPLLHPLVVAPLEFGQAADHRGGSRARLALEGVGIRLAQQLSLRGLDLVLVERADIDTGKEDLPDPALVARAHGETASVPGIEVADQADPLGFRRPDCEGHPANPAHGRGMGAELLEAAQVVAFPQQVDVQISEDRWEAVGILDLSLAARLRDPKPVVEEPPAALHATGEKARVVHALQLGHRLSGGGIDHHSALDVGQERAHHHCPVAPLEMHAEEGEGVVVVGSYDGRDGVFEALPPHGVRWLFEAPSSGLGTEVVSS